MQGRENPGQIQNKWVQSTSESPADDRATHLEAVHPVDADGGDGANIENGPDFVERAEALRMEE